MNLLIYPKLNKMPDNPTDKKLTFVEWIAKEKFTNATQAKKVFVELYGDTLLDGIHNENCTDELAECRLCMLQQMLSEYHKYFKQNN